MSEIITTENNAIQQYHLGKEEIATLISSGIIPNNTPEGNIKMFARYCSETNLSPFKRQVHLVKRYSKDGDKYTIQTGIDGYRAIANRTGVYAGNDDYRFDEGLSQYECMQSNRKHPQIAIATVYKLVGGVRVPFTASAEWSAYCPPEKQMFMWTKMPFLMLGKCAEAIALRKAFPEEISGIYTDEEMQQADVVVETKKEAVKPEVQEAVIVENKKTDFFDDTEKRNSALSKIHGAKDVQTIEKIETYAHKLLNEGIITEETFKEIGVEITKKLFELQPRIDHF